MKIKFRNKAYINQHLYLKSEQANCVYYLVDGLIRTYNDHPTKNTSITFQIIHPKSYFGYFELFTNDKKRVDSACVISKEAVIEEYSANDFIDHLLQNNDFFLETLRATIKNETEIWNRIIVFREYISYRKIGWMLIKMATPIDGKEDTLIITDFTHQLLGEYTGSSRQSITSALNHYRKLGIIDYNRKQITIRRTLMNKSIE